MAETNNAQPVLAFDARSTVDEELLQLVIGKARDLQIVRAVLVDDRLAPSTDPDLLWPKLIGPIENDAALFETVSDILDEHGTGNPRITPAPDVFDRVRAAVHASGNVEAQRLLSVPANPEAEVQALEEHLNAIGIAVDKFWQVTADVPDSQRLYFIDYQMRPGDPAAAGEDAARLLKKLLGQVLARGGVPPGAVLMSRNENGRLRGEDWEKVAEDGGFLRLNFRYVDKTRFRNRNEFLLVLLELLESMPLASKYIDHVRSMRMAARKIVRQCAADLAGLLPTDFVMFAERLTGGSAALRTRVAEHLYGLFTGLLVDGLRKDFEVQRSLNAFVDTLTGCNIMVPEGDTSRALNQLHSRLLYDRTEAVRSGPIAFGDIYYQNDKPDFLHLVITPECDLDPRLKKPERAAAAEAAHPATATCATSTSLAEEAPAPKTTPVASESEIPEPAAATPEPPAVAGTGAVTAQSQVTLGPKVQFVLMIRGEMSDRQPDQKHNEIPTRLAADPVTKRLRWIRWKLQEPAVMPVATLAGRKDGWLKWGRLREREAEKIQMRFATELLEVGTDDVSEHVNDRPAVLTYYRRDDDHKLLGHFTIQEISEHKGDKKSTYWAFAAASEELFCRADAAVIPARVVAELRCYLPRADVITKLAKSNVFVDEASDAIYFIRHDRVKPRKGFRPARATDQQQEPQPPPAGA